MSLSDRDPAATRSTLFTSLLSLAPVLALASLFSICACNSRVNEASGRSFPGAPTQGRPAATEMLEVSGFPFSSGSSAAYTAALIEGVPHVKQKPDFCGEACVEMALRKLGRPLSQDVVFRLASVDPALGRGAYTRELTTAVERAGFEPGQVFFPIDPSKAEEGLSAQFAALHKDLAAGVPSIVCMHYSDSPQTTEHFRLILGYDPKTDEVIYNEPAEDGGGYRRMQRSLFLKLWPLKGSESAWTAIRLRLKPSADPPAPPPPEPKGFAAADYAQHVMDLRKKIGKGFTILVEPPFVVIGDGSPERVKRQSVDTVRWAAMKLKADYFAKDPSEILDVWLFKDRTSYLDNTLALFQETPSTPYGYYSSGHKALIMNIATGGGTLVHEIVHPFVEANFPDCPSWLNEGLGSLYEQCGEENGHIYGYPNWRLPSLKTAIREGRVPSFKTLLSTTRSGFYNDDPGTNYAQSRYLVYYLQEQGLLVRFYHAFYARRAEDPTGYDTLKRTLGVEDLEAWKPRWEEFVLGLQFPPNGAR